VISQTVIEGPDADQFALVSPSPTTLPLSSSTQLTLRFNPTRLGPMNARLKITSNDPDSTANPFILNLPATGILGLAATKTGVRGSAFTYSALSVEKATGLVIQKLVFANRTGLPLKGLRVILSGVKEGVTVNSSSAGDTPGTVDVIYSKPVAVGETATFFLSYVDPKRRTTASIQPFIMAEALLVTEPRSGALTGTIAAVNSIVDTLSGPLLRWSTEAGAIYVVEYSDDGGTTWFSAVHRLISAGTSMTWIDRGQPETWAKPLNKAARTYRVKRL
jgi:hypothetical protein